MGTNYVQNTLDALNIECPGLEPELAQLYALLVHTMGPYTSLEDVHDAWSLWRNTTAPEHRSLIPFDELSREVQEMDREYRDAIRRTALKVAGTS